MRNSRLSVVVDRLRCPVCHASLEPRAEEFVCTSPTCATSFPLVDGIPVLLNESASVFRVEDFVRQRDTTFDLHRSTLEGFVDRILELLPSITGSANARQNYEHFGRIVAEQATSPRVLVIGGSILGDGMQALVRRQEIDIVSTDVSFGPLTDLVCDAHDIPFQDETFDGVIAQAVLEHVVDPVRCVSELHRVLKPGGVIYAETPFMQQVHMGRFDFTRFTHSGHRRLFRHFSELASGPMGGPGMALAWSYQYFLLSFTTSRPLRALLRAFASVTAFFLKYADYYFINETAAIDAASGFYFVGRKGEVAFSDQDLLKYYKGALS